MQSVFSLVGLSVLLGIVTVVPAAAEEQVDLELVLAVDVSGSMDSDELQLQRSGYRDAILSPEVLDAVTSGLTGRIALTYLEWAGAGNQRTVVPWMLIDGPQTAAQFADALDQAPVGNMRGTSISDGLMTSATLFADNGFAGYRQVIDISGDGPNNSGKPVIAARDLLLEAGIVINGLPITMRRGTTGIGSVPDLDQYYANCVIGGPGAFLVTVEEPSQWVDAIRRKMVLEIADLSGGDQFLVRPVADPAYDCLVGERQRDRWVEP